MLNAICTWQTLWSDIMNVKVGLNLDKALNYYLVLQMSLGVT